MEQILRYLGADPSNDSVQAIARRWRELIDEFTGKNSEIEQSLNRMYQLEGVETASRGMGDTSEVAI
jgi:MerR family transcriptional regulator, thiopeptide resistance regulator